MISRASRDRFVVLSESFFEGRYQEISAKHFGVLARVIHWSDVYSDQCIRACISGHIHYTKMVKDIKYPLLVV